MLILGLFGKILKNKICIWKEKEKFALRKCPYFFSWGLRIKIKIKSLGRFHNGRKFLKIRPIELKYPP